LTSCLEKTVGHWASCEAGVADGVSRPRPYISSQHLAGIHVVR
jgi:hypothetical protein